MNGIWGLILICAFVGIVALLCLFSCILASIADGYWDEVKIEMEKKNDGH